MKPSARKSFGRVPLRGAQVQYNDGRIATPPPLDVDAVLSRLERQDEAARADFLCAFAHSLTVDIRAMLLDRPVSEADLDRVSRINELLHQLTSCVNPRHRRGASGEAELVRAIVEDAYLYNLESAVGRALATAAGSTLTVD